MVLNLGLLAGNFGGKYERDVEIGRTWTSPRWSVDKTIKNTEQKAWAGGAGSRARRLRAVGSPRHWTAGQVVAAVMEGGGKSYDVGLLINDSNIESAITICQKLTRPEP